MSAQGFAKKPVAAAPAPAPTAPAKPSPTGGFAGARPSSVELKFSPHAVRRRAYEVYTKRIAEGRPGDDQSDWLEAERELKR